MWKKEEDQTGSSPAESTLRSEKPRTATSHPGRATIGPSISIKGDVTGSEDLLIEGKVDGSVNLELHSVAVGAEGKVNANITGRVITIEGVVEGDLTAQEQIILRGSAHVQGDIKAPRVVLEDGATFRGLVDMGAAPTGVKAAEATKSEKASGPTASKSDNGSSVKQAEKSVSSQASGAAGSSTGSSTTRPSGVGDKKPSATDRARA